MATCYCACGAKYRVPDSAVGKQAKCKKCGATFTLEAEDDGPIPIADEIGLAGEAAAAARRAPAAVADQGQLVAPPGSPAALAAATLPGSVAPDSTESRRSYVRDVVWTFLFLASPANLIAFVVLWLVLAIAPFFFMGCYILGFIVWLMISGWYAAFLFKVLESAAAGEEELPNVPFSSDVGADVLAPLFRWIGSWVAVLLPALVYLFYVSLQGSLSFWDALAIALGGIDAMLQGSGDSMPTFNVLLYVGVAFWPIVVLCVALGGFATLYRFDLILRTIVQTFPVYVLTMILILGAILLQHFLAEYTTTGIVSRAGSSISGLLGGALLISTLLVGLGIYVEIVVMRLVGLYYYHFKHRFAWDWG